MLGTPKLDGHKEFFLTLDGHLPKDLFVQRELLLFRID